VSSIYAYVVPVSRPGLSGGGPRQQYYAVRSSADGHVLFDRLDETVAGEFAAALNVAYAEGLETGKANPPAYKKKTTAEKLFPEPKKPMLQGVIYSNPLDPSRTCA
jgi:hypothetical protein